MPPPLQKDSEDQVEGPDGGGGSGSSGGGVLSHEGSGGSSHTLETLVETLSWLRKAIELDPSSYNAWHAWALMNYQLTKVGVCFFCFVFLGKLVNMEGASCEPPERASRQETCVEVRSVRVQRVGHSDRV